MVKKAIDIVKVKLPCNKCNKPTPQIISIPLNNDGKPDEKVMERIKQKRKVLCKDCQ